MQKTLKVLEKWYEAFGESQGFENSCHIMREQGPDISLMTEIVYRNEENVFPAISKVMQTELLGEQDSFFEEKKSSDHKFPELQKIHKHKSEK